MKILLLYLLLAIPETLYAQWGPDTKLSKNEVSASFSENMAQSIVAVGSTLHVVWADSGIDSGAIFYKQSLDGGVTWGPDTKISGASGHDSFPLLAVSGNYVHVVFLENSDTPQAASYYKRSTDGGKTWGPGVFLATTKWWPSVAAAGNMVYVALETLVTPTNSEVFFMRSTDNGNTWGAKQQISNADGRSEDPAIAAQGNYVDLVWNDNRDTFPGRGMAVYFRRSSDMGVTWGPETALTHAPAFTYFPTIFLSGSNADVPYGNRLTAGASPYQIFYQHSSDFGSTWATPQQITNIPGGGAYPSVARDGSNVHLTWAASGGVMYQHSGDGGATWDPAVQLTDKGGWAFIAVSGKAVHVVFQSQRDSHKAIYYKSNPTGNP